MASHNIARGQLDEVSHQYHTISSTPDTSTSSKSDNASMYFLAPPFTKKLDFYVKSVITFP